MMKKQTVLGIMFLLAGLTVRAATVEEWTFCRDAAGTALSNAYNSAGSAAFALSPGYNDSFVRADGEGFLLSMNDDAGSTTGMWTDGALLAADVASTVSTGTRFLRYDFEYYLSNASASNDSGCVVGFSFYDSTGDNVAGVTLQYDTGAAPSTPYQVTQVTEITNFIGSVAVVAKLDIDAKTLDVWYDLTGDVSGFQETFQVFCEAEDSPAIWRLVGANTLENP